MKGGRRDGEKEEREMERRRKEKWREGEREMERRRKNKWKKGEKKRLKRWGGGGRVEKYRVGGKR